MHQSRLFISIFILPILILSACQGGASPTPEAAPTQVPAPTLPPSPTSTVPPTATPTETPAEIALEPGQCVELIENGGFETGTLEPWILNSNLGKAGIANFRPGSGQYSTVLGDGLNADERLEIELTIPANAASAMLSFWADYMSQETGSQANDVLNISVQTTDGQITGLFRLDNTSPKVDPHRVFDLTEYAGQTFHLFFHAQTDAQNRSDFSIDDVSLEACGPTQVAESAATQTPASAPTLGRGECVELIQNGDFETGSAAPWKETSSVKPSLLAEFPGARGRFSGFLGGGSGFEESLSQEVEIPSSAATVSLSYWWAHGGHENDGKAHDFLKVLVQDLGGSELTTLEEISNITPSDRQFSQSTQDLTDYIGQSVQIVFHVLLDAQNDSDFFVDDVSIQACGPK